MIGLKGNFLGFDVGAGHVRPGNHKILRLPEGTRHAT
jgi:hypothetical protein